MHQTPGFRLLEATSRPEVARWERWQSEHGESVLLWPLTFMNLSGQAVEYLGSQLSQPLSPERSLVVVDDLSLPLGGLRLRTKGSSGGHNGLKSLQAHWGHSNYPRLRLGIGQPNEHDEVIDFVLAPFPEVERAAVGAVATFAASAVAEWLEGVSPDELMGKVNSWRLA